MFILLTAFNNMHLNLSVNFMFVFHVLVSVRFLSTHV